MIGLAPALLLPGASAVAMAQTNEALHQRAEFRTINRRTLGISSLAISRILIAFIAGVFESIFITINRGRNVMRIRVVVADDHPVVRLGVCSIIDASSTFSVVAEATAPSELHSVLSRHAPDVLVCDFLMPSKGDADGNSMLKSIIKRHPKLPILVLTSYRNTLSLQYAIKMGVAGILAKSSSLDLLPEALKQVYRGATYISPELRSLFEAPPDNVPSPKELEVLRLYASGRNISEIAIQLNRSAATISCQKISAMKKFQLKSDAELFTFADNSHLAHSR